MKEFIYSQRSLMVYQFGLRPLYVMLCYVVLNEISSFRQCFGKSVVNSVTVVCVLECY